MELIRKLCGGHLPAAIMFDLDGTLVESAPDLADAVDFVLEHAGYPAPGEVLVRQWVGNGASKLLERALAHARGIELAEISGAEHRRLLEHFFIAYKANCCRRTTLFDSVMETLEFLHLRGIKLAIVTNKPAVFTAQIVDQLGLRSLFSVCASGDSYPQKKPHPLPLQMVASEMAVDLADCLMVGDSQTDIAAAQAAGIPVVCVSFGYHQGVDLTALADTVIDEFISLKC
ncbi:MAG: phosphoglycolate phosphatase [Pseudomonadales bacterium]